MYKISTELKVKVTVCFSILLKIKLSYDLCPIKHGKFTFHYIYVNASYIGYLRITFLKIHIWENKNEKDHMQNIFLDIFEKACFGLSKDALHAAFPKHCILTPNS